MFKLLFLSIFTIFIVSGISSGNEETTENANDKIIPNTEVDKHVLKRYDQEYQTCLENFDIHKDKIIRTQDSREMGAKYINEFDLASRDECLRACCGTETCDVFVFEEKSPGSCYLFHCGPPDDFKCKFTKHHNYTSAVLASNRHLNELENQIKLTKHEQELTQLRKPEATAQSTGTPFISTTIVAPEPPKERVQMGSTSTINATSDRHCSVYQFECRSSGECIAIYNACDGIPQCADGSDEAPELDCPAQGTTQPSPPPPPPRPSTPSLLVAKVAPIAEPPLQRNNPIQEPAQQQHAQPPITPQQAAPGYNNGGQVFRQQLPPQGWQPPLPQTQQQAQPPMMAQYPAQHGEGINQEKGVFPLGANLQLPAKIYGVEGEGQPNYNMPWNNNYQHVPAGQYPPTGGRQYQDGTSHIFNHKGNGLVADSDSPAGQYDNRNDYNSKYPGNNMYYNNAPYRPPVSPNMWQPNHQQQAHDGNSMPNVVGEMSRPETERKMPLPPDYYYEDSQAMAGQEGRFHGQHHDHDGHDHDHDSSLHQEARPYPHHSAQKNVEEAPSNPVQMQQQPKQMSDPSLESNVQQNLASMPHRNKGSIDVHVKPEKAMKHNSEATTTESAPKSGGSVKKRVKPEESSKERVSEEDFIIEGDMGGNRPTGAILSLALGLCITGLLVTLVGCRVRVIKKRLRRGSKTYAHDADYLVNGMYL